MVEASTLVVVGYSGWDDVITRTLVELLSDSASNPEIMWAFHGDDTATIEASNERLLDVLTPGIGRGRVSLYRGIDCCSVFSEVYEQLKPSYLAASGPVLPAIKCWCLPHNPLVCWSLSLISRDVVLSAMRAGLTTRCLTFRYTFVCTPTSLLMAFADTGRPADTSIQTRRSNT